MNKIEKNKIIRKKKKGEYIEIILPEEVITLLEKCKNKTTHKFHHHDSDFIIIKETPVVFRYCNIVFQDTNIKCTFIHNADGLIVIANIKGMKSKFDNITIELGTRIESIKINNRKMVNFINLL